MTPAGPPAERPWQVTAGCEWVFNMAADMGGMGFIHSNAAVLLYNNTMISFNMVEVRTPPYRAPTDPLTR